MSLSRMKYNKITLIISTITLVFFFITLFIYKNDISFRNEHYIIEDSLTDPFIGTTTPIETSVIDSTSTTTTTEKTPKPITKPQVVPSIGHEIGIASGSKLVGLSNEKLNSELIGMVDLGIKWVRFDIEWGFVQYGSPKKYDWSKYDRIVDALNRHNLKPLPILTYTPEWARVPGCRGGSHCPPQDPNTFAKFASDAVIRYKTKGVHYWEIWNEPNSYDFWATKADCKAYTELLKVSYVAIKKADPTAFVITGGLAQLSTTDVNVSALDFLQCIYDNGGKNYFDAVGNHPYTFPQIPSDSISNAWARMSLTSPSFRSIMIVNGDGGKKIWMTEYGAPTNGPDSNWYISEDRQVKMVVDTMEMYKNEPWAGPIFWYTYIDSGFEPTTNENFFGLVRFDESLKPAYNELKKIILRGI